MKHLFTFTLILGSFLCSNTLFCQHISINKINVYLDTFKASKTTTLVQKMIPRDKSSGLYEAVFTFEKIQKANSTTLFMHVVLSKQDLSLAIEKTAYIKAHDKFLDLPLSYVNVNQKINHSVSSETIMAMDSIGTNTVVETSSTNSWMQSRFKVTLSAEIIEALIKSVEPPQICFYSSSIPVKIDWKGTNWLKLKEFLML
jgi:GH15 family glucan-1,4-alpha-glucosidase